MDAGSWSAGGVAPAEAVLGSPIRVLSSWCSCFGERAVSLVTFEGRYSVLVPPRHISVAAGGLRIGVIVSLGVRYMGT